MIQDTVRTSTYASFILSNPEIFENAVVLDVGCGTGVLSLFAASAGASHVYAIDASEIAHKAEQIVRDNKMQDKIT
jgi:protein arginine N-methyltransferase 3